MVYFWKNAPTLYFCISSEKSYLGFPEGFTVFSLIVKHPFPI